MTEQTDRFALPFIVPGQAQKEMAHNEALATIDLALQPIVEAVALDDPPASPAVGQMWIVGPSPTGAWVAHAGALAGWTAAGWRFVAPRAGLAARIAATGEQAVHDSARWVIGDVAAARIFVAGAQVVGGRQAAIADAVGGTTIDGEARTAITAILTALRAHGLIAT